MPPLSASKSCAVTLSETFAKAVKPSNGALPKTRYPALVCNESAAAYVKLIGNDQLRNNAVIDMNGGVGAMASAICHNKGHVPRRMVIAEKHYHSHLSELVHSLNTPATQVTVHNYEPMAATFYRDLIGADMLGNSEYKPDPQWVSSWDQPSKIMALASLPIKTGDLVITHLMHWMWEKAGVHTFGPTPLYIFSPRDITERIIAQPGSLLYGRIAITAAALSHIDVLHRETTRSCFWPHKCFVDLIRFTPRPKPLFNCCTFEDFEFAQRGIFIKKLQPVKEALKTLDPTNSSLAKLLPPKILDTVTRELTVERFCIIAEAFSHWPLKDEFYSNELVSAVK